jgi:2,4-dienoyl-CoA reductase-like NADH-dependent reductase (Old Yellow Enzyme family)
MTSSPSPEQTLDTPLNLPCGAVLKNRIAKSAMSDSLADGRGDPTPEQARLYERWAKGGAALSIVGEVQGDSRFPEKPGNLVLDGQSDENALRRFTARGSVNGVQLWAQLGHAGALSHPPISRPQGPSALDVPGLHCRGMSVEEVEELPGTFAATAARAKALGFTGIQLHAALGFLLSQFLSPLFNRRRDGYGGSIEGRSRIVLDVIEKVRNAVGPTFPIGIKLNATDNLEGGLTQDDALEVVRFLDSTSVDLIDISGGTYFPGAKAASDGGGAGPYFLDFARRARTVTDIPLMLTGGFKTRSWAAQVVQEGAADVVGLARAMVLRPRLPELWLAEDGDEGDPGFPRFQEAPPGGITAWYTMRLTALAEDAEHEYRLDLPSAVAAYEERDRLRCRLWADKFHSGASAAR